MQPDHIIARERDANFNLLKDILNVIAGRPFVKQIRSEECGCCTRAIAEKISEWVASSKEDGFQALIWLLENILSYRHLPQFTLSLLESALVLTSIQARKVRDSVNTPHMRFCEAVDRLAARAEELYLKDELLLFSRIAEPIILISPSYRRLCQSYGLEIVGSTDASIGKMIELRDEVVADQAHGSEWAEANRSRPGNGMRYPKVKRIWSGGVCEIIRKSDTTETITGKMKIAYYGQQGMKVFSRRLLDASAVYTCRARFNCIDLPFMVNVRVGKPEREAGDYDKECMAQCGASHCYVLSFASEEIEPSPSPRYYFLSMCRDLLEYGGGWEAKVFGEVLCDPEWGRPSLGDD